jgi:cardiolipin synthase
MLGMQHLPNVITALRFLLVPVVVLLLVRELYVAAFAVFLLSALSDLADGWIARRWSLRTRWGAVADPLADKLTMLAVTVVLASQRLIPLWLAVAIVARDVLIVGGAVAFHFLVGRVDMAPSWLSKFNTVLEFCVLSALWSVLMWR